MSPLAPGSESSAALIAAIAAGDRDAFGRFYDLTAPMAFGLIRRVLHDPEAAAEVSEAQIADVFGLTAGQAKVARALLTGRSPRQTAEALGLSFFTVRAHLARIFEKTGTSRQAELVALMSRTLGSASRLTE